MSVHPDGEKVPDGIAPQLLGYFTSRWRLNAKNYSSVGKSFVRWSSDVKAFGAVNYRSEVLQRGSTRHASQSVEPIHNFTEVIERDHLAYLPLAA